MDMLADFVERQQRNAFDPPVRSLMDIDFYKFTMGQNIYKNYPDVQATFELINRDSNIPLAEIVSQKEIIDYLDYARSLKFTYTDIAWLRGMRVYGANMFSEDYTRFLENFQLPPYQLRKIKNQYALKFSGSWKDVSMWETIALAIISELYYRQLMKKMTPYELDILYARAKDKIWRKLELLRQYLDIFLADFGQRRRHSFLWQQWVIGLCKIVLGKQFTGTSNTWMAFHHDLMPIGTDAHERPMVLTALADSNEEKKEAQYRVLSEWQELYGAGLRICLPDTYGTAQFLTGAPDWLASEWRGLRQDSGDPRKIACYYIEWLKKKGVDPREKLIIFSDGLDVEQIIDLHKEFSGEIKTAFGWGTLLTNDFRDCCPRDDLKKFFRPFSIVCKVTKVNGRPAVKLSDNIQKATGPKSEIRRYLKIFGGAEERVNRPVLV